MRKIFFFITTLILFLPISVFGKDLDFTFGVNFEGEYNKYPYERGYYYRVKRHAFEDVNWIQQDEYNILKFGMRHTWKKSKKYELTIGIKSKKVYFLVRF